MRPLLLSLDKSKSEKISPEFEANCVTSGHACLSYHYSPRLKGFESLSRFWKVSMTLESFLSCSAITPSESFNPLTSPLTTKSSFDCSFLKSSCLDPLCFLSHNLFIAFKPNTLPPQPFSLEFSLLCPLSLLCPGQDSNHSSPALA